MRNMIHIYYLITLYNVSFYNIGHRMQILATLLHQMRHRFTARCSRTEKPIAIDFSTDERLFLVGIKRVRRLHTKLWRATDALSSAFSSILLINTTMNIIATTLFSYLIVEGYLFPKAALEKLRWVMISCLIMNWAVLLFILTSSDAPVQQVGALPSHGNLVHSKSLITSGQEIEERAHQAVDGYVGSHRPG